MEGVPNRMYVVVKIKITLQDQGDAVAQTVGMPHVRRQNNDPNLAAACLLWLTRTALPYVPTYHSI